MYLFAKLAHLFFMISWFAGLFYLPRIFVNLAAVSSGSTEYRHLLGMAQRLYRFMTPLGIFAVLCGLALAGLGHWWGSGWVHTKITLGVMLLGYHFYCGRLLADFEEGHNRYSHKWYRVFNEIPVIIMLLALILVVYKPF